MMYQEHKNDTLSIVVRKMAVMVLHLLLKDSFANQAVFCKQFDCFDQGHITFNFNYELMKVDGFIKNI
jgi:hypothetical protein